MKQNREVAATHHEAGIAASLESVCRADRVRRNTPSILEQVSEAGAREPIVLQAAALEEGLPTLGVFGHAMAPYEHHAQVCTAPEISLVALARAPNAVPEVAAGRNPSISNVRNEA